jgi:hypothetical protein
LRKLSGVGKGVIKGVGKGARKNTHKIVKNVKVGLSVGKVKLRKGSMVRGRALQLSLIGCS